MLPLKIATWNVNGIRARKDELTDFLARESPDVLCLQEIKATLEQIPESLCELEGYHCYWYGGAKGYSGIGLHVKRSWAGDGPELFNPPFDLESRIAVARTGNLHIASIYVPNGGKDFAAKIRFLEAMRAYAKELHDAGSLAIFCGDMNVARTERDVHPKERKPNAIGQLPQERALIETILTSGSMRDVARDLDPDNDALFTWWAPWRNLRQRNIGWRLDYLFASEELARRATDCRSLREFGTSDHAPVVATFAAP
jgi:exodeoxyribonuclease-3